MNIVYLGDEVMLISKPDIRGTVVGADTDLLVLSDGLIDRPEQFATLDGVVIDGFGGAKVEPSKDSDGFFYASIQGVEIDSPALDETKAINYVLAHADKLYGPWQQPYTLADLRRRGFLQIPLPNVQDIEDIPYGDGYGGD